MWKAAALVGVVLALVGCAAPSAPEVVVGMRVRTTCPSPAEDDYFFPAGLVIPSSEGADRVQRAAYSTPLRMAGAVSRSCGADDGESYRLSYLPQIGIGWIVEVVAAEKQWHVSMTRVENPLWRAPSVKNRVTDQIPVATAIQLANDLRQAGFWTMPPRGGGQDAPMWVLEGKRLQKYRVVSGLLHRDKPFNAAVHAFDSVMPELATFLRLAQRGVRPSAPSPQCLHDGGGLRRNAWDC